MRRWLKGLAGLALTFVLAVAIVTAYGAFALPREHEAAATVHIDAPRERVFEVLEDVERSDEWRPSVERVEMLGELDGHVRWREHGADGALILQRTESEPPRRMVVRVASEDESFGGSWAFELERTTRGTALTITERGWMDNPLSRVLAHHLIGLDATIRDYAQALEKRVEQRAEEQRAE